MKLGFSAASVEKCLLRIIPETMKERIDRQTDENLYQPKIHSEQIRELHRVSEDTGLPMTVLVNVAIREFLIAYPTVLDLWLEKEDEVIKR